LNGTYLLLVCADVVKLLHENMNSIKTNTETLLHSGNKVALKVKAKETKHMFMFRHQTTGQNYYIKVAENVAKLKYLGKNLN
jgi:hypothetical protein